MPERRLGPLRKYRESRFLPIPYSHAAPSAPWSRNSRPRRERLGTSPPPARPPTRRRASSERRTRASASNAVRTAAEDLRLALRSHDEADVVEVRVHAVSGRGFHSSMPLAADRDTPLIRFPLMSQTPDPLDEFPRQAARTLRVPARRAEIVHGLARRRTRGVPPDEDRVSCLWVFDVAGAKERLVCSTPRPEEAEAELAGAERARREAPRVSAAPGVTAYATDEAVRQAVFAVGGRLFLADLVEGSARELTGTRSGRRSPPRPGRRAGRVRRRRSAPRPRRRTQRARARLTGGSRTRPRGPAPSVAAEEMDRSRPDWWSPDGTRIAAARIDERGDVSTLPHQRSHRA